MSANVPWRVLVGGIEQLVLDARRVELARLVRLVHRQGVDGLLEVGHRIEAVEQDLFVVLAPLQAGVG